MNDELRNSLWNVLRINLLGQHFRSPVYWMSPPSEEFAINLWANFLKQPIDAIPSTPAAALASLRTWFTASPWYAVYDFVEYVLKVADDRDLNSAVNGVLERELSGYRFIGGVITPVTDAIELGMLESALADRDSPAVSAHLKTALERLSDRDHPDYRNSIKESISAVESMAREVTGDRKATLGDALKTLERKGNIHPALKEAFSKLYGYTSDEGGIRHAMSDEPNLTLADARFFLMACTSFINYLKSRL